MENQLLLTLSTNSIRLQTLFRWSKKKNPFSFLAYNIILKLVKLQRAGKYESSTLLFFKMIDAKNEKKIHQVADKSITKVVWKNNGSDISLLSSCMDTFVFLDLFFCATRLFGQNTETHYRWSHQTFFKFPKFDRPLRL